jgi:uncharacterized repeat protein (TIGR02543 family)
MLYASWTVCEYNVTFDSQGGTCSTLNKQVTYGKSYGTLPTPARKGYMFIGWYTEKNGGTIIDENDTVYITSKQTLYAKWEEVKIAGDINQDYSLTVSDAVLLQKYLLSTYTFTKEQLELADMTGDGKVNVFDLCLMKNKLINS